MNISAKPKKPFGFLQKPILEQKPFTKTRLENAGFHGNEVKFEMSFEDWKS